MKIILTVHSVACIQRIGRDEVNRRTVIGLSELDALCDSHEHLRAEVERLSHTFEIADARADVHENMCAEQAATLARVEALLGGNMVFDQQMITVGELREALKAPR